MESQGQQSPIGYERPWVERVLTLEDLEREVLYAGLVDGSGDPG
jgi:hypothetical protein